MSAPAAGRPYEDETPAEAARRQRVGTGPLTLLQGGTPGAATPTFTPRNGTPYPPPPGAYDTSPEAVRRLAQATQAWPHPAPEAEAEHRYPTLGALMDAKMAEAHAPELPVRVRGASLPAHMRPRPLPAAAAEEPEPLPEPEPEPDPEPLAAVAVPEGLHAYLRTLVGNAALGISTLIARDGYTAELIEQAGRLARFDDALKLADDSDAALRALVTEGGR